MNNPTVSVIMGVYYSRKNTSLLARSVESILAQSFYDFEFLICDDGSSREAQDLLRSYAQGDGRVRILPHRDLFPLAQKLNYCLSEANGRYIARMDDDDYSHPERLKRQISKLELTPACGFVGCNVQLIRDNCVIGKKVFPEYPLVEDFLLVQPYIHPTLVFRREALNAVGGYSESPKQLLCEDYDLLLRMYAKGIQGANLQECLLDYTVPNIRGNRKMRHRWNEVLTRWARFRELNLLPWALPYVIKPIAVGLVPSMILGRLKNHGVREIEY